MPRSDLEHFLDATTPSEAVTDNGGEDGADAHHHQTRQAKLTDSGSAHGRDVTDTAFYEWLPSDHQPLNTPEAKAAYGAE